MMVGECTRNPTEKVVSKNDSNKFILLNNLVVVSTTATTQDKAGMARIRGLEVRTMTGKVVPTRRTRGRRAAWFIFQREEPTPHRRGAGV